MYPDENSAFWATTVSPAPVLVVENDDGLVALDPVSPQLGVLPAVESPSFRSVVPKRGPVPKAPPFSADDIASISQHLKLLSDCLSGLADSPSHVSAPPAPKPVAPKLLLSLSPDEVVRLVHRPVLCLCRYVLAIVPTALTQKRIRPRRSFIVLLGVAVFAIIRTSSRPVWMANGLMGASSCYRWALM